MLVSSSSSELITMGEGHSSGDDVGVLDFGSFFIFLNRNFLVLWVVTFAA